MLDQAMVVPTVAVSDQAKRFFGEQVGLTLLEETPFTLRFGVGRGTQLAIRKGQPNVGQKLAHFEVDDIERSSRNSPPAASSSRSTRRPRPLTSSPRSVRPRGAWFSDADGNIFGVREGPVPGGK